MLTDAARAETYPHPYPNAWYRLLDAAEVASGSSTAVDALGKRFLVIRDAGGNISVLDGHCPHLGAELPAGPLKDNCVTCPFHAWKFEPSGRVRAIPYTDRIPKNLSARTFPAVEQDGQIFAWLAQHGDNRAPAYTIESAPEIASGALVARGSYDGGIVGMHIMEFVENGPDVNHFGPVHTQMHLPWSGINVPGMGVSVAPTWRLDPARPHVAWLDTYATLTIGGKTLPALGANASVEFLGPGSVARFHFEKKGVGKLLLYQTHTPIAPLAQRVRFRWYASPELPRLASWWVVGHWISQWRDDVRIWEKKIHRKKPHLVANDGAILSFRRWFNQFYGETPAETPLPRGETQC